jgi:lysyl-tRNA synthetase class 2
MMDFTEKLLETICVAVNGTTEVRRRSGHFVQGALHRAAHPGGYPGEDGFDLSDKTEEEIYKIAPRT